MKIKTKCRENSCRVETAMRFGFFPRPLSKKIRRTLLVTCNVALSNFGFWYKTKTQTSLTTLVKYDQKWALVAHLNKVAI